MCFVPSAIAFVAKLALAYTLHMRAAHLLLDRLATLGTLPCIITDPARVGLFGVDNGVPSLHIFADHWIMRFSAAAIAVELTARTGDSAELHHVWLDAKIGAFLIGTVADVFILQSIAHTSFLSIQLRQFWCHHLYKTTQGGRTRACWNMHTTRKNTSFQELVAKITHPTACTVSVRTQTSGKETGMIQTNRALSLRYRRLVQKLVVCDFCLRQSGPILSEIEVGQFLLVPLVIMQHVKTEIFAFNIDYVANVCNFFHQIGIELFILDELGLELFAGRFVHAKLTSAAGIGVGVAQLQI